MSFSDILCLYPWYSGASADPRIQTKCHQHRKHIDYGKFIRQIASTHHFNYLSNMGMINKKNFVMTSMIRIHI